MKTKIIIALLRAKYTVMFKIGIGKNSKYCRKTQSKQYRNPTSNFKVLKCSSGFSTEIYFLATIGERQDLNNTGTQCQTVKLQNFGPLFVLNSTYTKSSSVNRSPLRSDFERDGL